MFCSGISLSHAIFLAWSSSCPNTGAVTCIEWLYDFHFPASKRPPRCSTECRYVGVRSSSLKSQAFCWWSSQSCVLQGRLLCTFWWDLLTHNLEETTQLKVVVVYKGCMHEVSQSKLLPISQQVWLAGGSMVERDTAPRSCPCRGIVSRWAERRDCKTYSPWG